MAHPLASEARRPPSVLVAPDGTASAESLKIAQDLVHAGGTTPPGGRFSTSPFVSARLVAIELAFAFGFLLLTRLSSAEVLQIVGGTTAISVGGFFGRDAIVIIGRRLLTGPGNQ
jgi:hypothetical protein